MDQTAIFCRTPGQGALQILGRHGNLVQNLTDPVLLAEPWDVVLDDRGEWARIFASNVLNGTVARFDVSVGESTLAVVGKTLVASGYSFVPNSAAVVLGRTGLAFDAATDTLYVASTNDNAIYAVARAGRASQAYGSGTVAFADAHLRGPIALRFAPNAVRRDTH